MTNEYNEYTQGQGNEGQDGYKERLFTQEEVNEIVKGRLKKGKKEPFPYVTYAEVKRIVAEKLQSFKLREIVVDDIFLIRAVTREVQNHYFHIALRDELDMNGTKFRNLMERMESLVLEVVREVEDFGKALTEED